MNYLKDICKLGQGNDCCRYLVMAPTGFECGKLDPALKRTLDQRVKSRAMHAWGDNCPGQVNLHQRVLEDKANEDKAKG